MRILVTTAAACLIGFAVIAQATDPSSPIHFKIEQQTLSQALVAFSQQSQRVVTASSRLLDGKTAPAIEGSMLPEEALRKLLQGTGLKFIKGQGGDLTVVPANAATENPRELNTWNADVSGAPAPEDLNTTGAIRLSRSNSSSSEACDKQDPSCGSELDEVVVTATKRSMDLKRVPMSITAIGGEELGRRGVVSAADYLNSVPGVTQLDLGVGVNQIIIRGIGVQLGESAAVSSYFGEVPLNTIGNSNSVDLKMVDLQRVEVLRGPQGTLFGSGSMGGTVRSIPVAPQLDSLEGKLEVGYSSTDGAGSDNYNGVGVINLPLVSDRLAARLVGYQFKDGGYVRNVGEDVPDVVSMAEAFGGAVANKRDIGRSEYTGFRAGLLWQATQSTDVNLNLITQDLDQTGFPSVSLLRGAYEDSPLRISPSGDKDEYLGDETNIVNLVVKHEASWADLLSTSTWFQGSRTRGVDLSRGFGLPVAQFDDNSSRGWVQELRFTSKIEGPLSYTGGLYYERLRRNWNTTNPWTGGSEELEAVFGPEADAAALYAGVIDYTVEQFAAFGEVGYQFRDHFELTVGGRWFDYTRHDVSENHGALAGGGGARDLESSEDGTTFKIDLSYTPSEGKLLYARWAEGFRLGRPILPAPAAVCDLDNDGFLDGTHAPIDSDAVKSDTLESYELGGKLLLLERRLSLHGAVYRINWEGIPLTVRAVPDCGFGTLINAGKARSTGAELESSILVTRGLRMDLGLSFIDAELAEDNAILGTRGTRLPGSAKFNSHVSLQYDFPLPGGRAAFVRGDYTRVGGFRNDIAGAFAEAGDYGKVDLRAGMNLGTYDIEVFATNLTNENALTAVEEDPNFAYRMRPRTVGAQLRYRF